MKKITLILLSVFISLYIWAQTPAGDGSASQTETTADTTQPAVVDTVLDLNPVFISSDSVNTLKASQDFSYLQNLDSLLREEQKEKRKEGASQNYDWLGKILGSVITRDIFWLLAIGFVGFILYKLFLSDGIFQKRSAYIKSDTMEADDDDETLRTISDYKLLIEKAIAAKDFRLAIRYLYLQALRQLSDDNKIQLAPDKTNYQYQLELKDGPLKQLFGLITYQYECVWYGRFEINESAFTSIRNDFKNFITQLSH